MASPSAMLPQSRGEPFPLSLEDGLRWYRITAGSKPYLVLATAKINPDLAGTMTVFQHVDPCADLLSFLS